MRDLFRRFDRAVWSLALTQLVTSAGFSLALPFLSLYLSRERGLSMSLVGTIMLLAAFAGALGQFLGGDLSDRFGRKPVLLGAILFRILVFMGLALLIFREGRIWGIVLTYMAVRLSGGLAMPPVFALLADLTAGKRVEGYGLLRVGANVGWALGPALGGYLASRFPYAFLFLFGAIATFLALLLVLFWVQEPGTRAVAAAARATFTAFKDPGFLRFLGTTIPVFLVAGQLVSTLSVFTVAKVGISEAQFGSLLTLNGLLVVVFQYPLARAVQGWPRRAGLALGALLYSLGYLSFGWIRSFPLMLLAMTVVTVGEMLFTPVAQAVAADLAPEEHRGRYLGAFGLVESFGWSGGAFLGGVLLDWAPNPQVLWGAISSLGFFAALVFGALPKGLHRALQKEAPRALHKEDSRPRS
jgi:MFS family permease